MGCGDNYSEYSFIMSNESSTPIELRFTNRYLNWETQDSVEIETLDIGQESVVYWEETPLGSQAHNCIKDHGMTYFPGLVFETYVNDSNINKQLWIPENWKYKMTSNWSANYFLTITDELIEK